MTIRALGELGIRVNDLERMTAFYRDVVGLEVFSEHDEYIFFKVAEAVEGHPQLLVLFDRKVTVGPDRSTLDHFAFLIDVADYDEHKERLEAEGVTVYPKTFPHFQWRSFFFYDPEGNLLEFVSYDQTVQ